MAIYSYSEGRLDWREYTLVQIWFHMKKLFPGLFVTIGLAACALVGSVGVPMLGGVTLALILGIVVGNLSFKGERFQPGIAYSEKTILTTAIMLMGFKLELGELGHIGSSVFYAVLPTMAVTIAAGILLGRVFGFSKRFSVLMGVGNAVCGASAIAAVAPAVNAEEEEIGVTIGIVNLLGTAGIFLMPWFVHAMGFSDLQSSYVIGGVLQAVGHVVAAGFSVNDSVGDTATLIKMLRVLMIGPVVMMAMLFFRSSGNGTGKKKYIPGYVIGFAVCSLLASVFHGDTVVLPWLKLAGKWLLVIAMAGVGMRIRFSSLVSNGPKALVHGILTTVIQTGCMVGILLCT